MSTDLQRICPSCGNEFSGAMEFCPVCLLRKGLAGGTESGESSVSEKTVEPARRFEHYELVTGEDGKPVELGRGAMGVTYKAFDVDLRCPVTLKVISERYLGDESAQLRFLREARAAARLRHSNVASVLHLGRTGNSYFYAMEFVEGETLENLIKRSGRLEVKLALEIATQVAAGLAAVHEQNLVQSLTVGLRIQACDLICRHDFNLWLPVVKSDNARDADGFTLDHSKPLIVRYRRSGCNESGESLIRIFSSEIDKCGPKRTGCYRGNPALYLNFFADILHGFRVFYHYRLVRVRRNYAERQSENGDEETDQHCGMPYILASIDLCTITLSPSLVASAFFSIYYVGDKFTC
jgi:hypothetical protein